MPWLTDDVGAVVLMLHIQPGAKKTEIVGMYGAALKIRLAAPPVDGKANQALINFLANHLGVSKRSVTLIGGETSRAKRLRIAGIDAETVRSQLRPAS